MHIARHDFWVTNSLLFKQRLQVPATLRQAVTTGPSALSAILHSVGELPGYSVRDRNRIVSIYEDNRQQSRVRARNTQQRKIAIRRTELQEWRHSEIGSKLRKQLLEKLEQTR